MMAIRVTTLPSDSCLERLGTGDIWSLTMEAKISVPMGFGGLKESLW
jgi:hypothetical protein